MFNFIVETKGFFVKYSYQFNMAPLVDAYFTEKLIETIENK